MIIPLISQEINDKDLKIWNNLTAEEKWESYKNAHNSYVELEKLYNSEVENGERTLKNLEKTNNILKKKHKKNSIGVFVLTGIDYDLIRKEFEVDCYAGLYYKRYFFYNLSYFQIGLNVKFYDDWGGGINLGIGINF
jgi:hypothetical protein